MRPMLRYALMLGVGAAVMAPLATPARAQTISRRVTTVYTGSNLSVWPAGQDTGSNLSPILLGPSWNIGPISAGGIYELVIPSIDMGLFTIPSFSLGKTGAKIEFGGTGQLGLQLTPWYTGGRMDYTYNAGVQLSYPRFPAAGQSVTVNATFTGGGGSYFRTTSPDFGASFGAVAQMTGYASSEAWFLGANLWQGNIFSPFSVGDPPKALTGLVRFNVPDEVNFLVSKLNPTPIGVEITKPVVEAYGQSVASDGTITGQGFGKFLSVETDALSWIALLFGKKDIILAPLSGDYLVPGTNYRVGWDIAKAYANLDIGFLGRYTLRPKPSIQLQVFNGQGALIAQGGQNVTFTMPSGSVRITPILTVDFELTNRFSFGTGGAIGMSPFKVVAKGSLGSGEHEKSIDIDFDPAKVEWQGDPSAGAKIKEATFNLPTASDRTRTLASVGINATNLLELPREVFAQRDGQFGAEIPAYQTDSDKEYYTLQVFPEQGRIFFAGKATLTATLQRADGTTVDLNTARQDDAEIEILLQKQDLAPGTYSISLTVDTRNTQEQPRKATYVIPVRVFPQTPFLDGELNLRQDLDQNFRTNRVTANGADTMLYVGVRNVYRNSEVVINGSIVLPSDITTDHQLTGDPVIGFRVPAYLAQELGGAENSIQIRTPNVGSDANGNPYPPVLSEARKLYFAAGRPSLSGLSINDVANAKVTLGANPVWVELRGTNFTRSTTVRIFGHLANAATRTALETVYSSPTALRVKVPADVMLQIHNNGRLNPSVEADTPYRLMEGISNVALTQESGGTSTPIGFGFAYPAPTITRLDPEIVIREVGGKVRVYGDNLFRPRTAAAQNATRITIAGQAVAAANLTAPAGSGMIVPYLEMNLPANHPLVTANGRRLVQAFNESAASLESALITENGRPRILSLSHTVLKVSPGRNYTVAVQGGPFYSDSVVSLNGTNLPTTRVSLTELRATVSATALQGIPGSSANFVVFNPTPGGGQSEAIAVTLAEGDASKIAVKPGVLGFDRKSNSYRQEITLTYTGTRSLSGNVNLQFRSLSAGNQLVNSNGTDEGFPYMRIPMTGVTQAKVIAIFRKVGTNPITYTPAVRIPD